MEIPEGYVLVRDPGVGQFQTPAGYRLEVQRRRGRPMRRIGYAYGPDFQARVRALREKMDLVEAMGVQGAGAFVKWSTSGKAPRMLVDMVRKRGNWVFLITSGGYLRLNPERKFLAELWDWKPGDWDFEVIKSPMPGFAVADYDGSMIRVRLPAMSMDLKADFIPGMGAPPEDPVRVKAIAAIRAAYADQPEVPDTLEKWLANAPTAELVRWVKENVPYSEATDGLKEVER